MKKKFYFDGVKVIVLISLIFLLNGTVGAYEMTARSLGMGAAYSAVADDIEAILYNPASVANAGVLGLSVNTGIRTYNQEYLEDLMDLRKNDKYGDIKEFVGELKDNAGAGTQLFLGARLNSIGLAYNVEQEFSINSTEDDYFTERISEGIISYGKQLLKPPFEIAALYYGVNFKYINIERSNYDLTKNLLGTAEGNAFSIDLGALAKVTDILRIACVIENALATTPELEGELREYEYSNGVWSSHLLEQSYTYKKELERKVRVGAAVEIPLINLTLAADLDNFLGAREKQVLHLGLEKNFFFNALSFRLGKAKGEELDLNTIGLGVNFTGFNLDLALGKNKTGNKDLMGILSASMDF